MKQAFTYSFIIHFSFAVLIIFLSSISFQVEKPQHIQLSMEIFNNNEGSGAVAKGIETSTSNVNVKSNANAVKNAQNNMVEQKEIKKIEDTALKTAAVKKEEIIKEKQKKQVNKQASKGAVMAAKGKAAGTGAGKKSISDGAPKSVGGVDGVYSLKEVDNVPKSLKSVRPVYPEYARNMRIEGFVQVRFILDDKGKIVNPKVVKAEPVDVFENAALNAVNQWKFQPAKKDGKNVNVAMVVKLNFKLDEQ